MDGGMTLLGGSILFKSDMPIMTVTDVAEQLRRLVLSSKSRLCVYVCVCACACVHRSFYWCAFWNSYMKSRTCSTTSMGCGLYMVIRMASESMPSG